MHLLGEAPKIVRWNRLRARPRLGAPPQTPSPQTFPAGGALRGGMRVDCWRREDGESGEPLSTEALTKGLSQPWREALPKIFSVRNVATPVDPATHPPRAERRTRIGNSEMNRFAARARRTHPLRPPPGPPLTTPPIAPNRGDITCRATPAAAHTHRPRAAAARATAAAHAPLTRCARPRARRLRPPIHPPAARACVCAAHVALLSPAPAPHHAAAYAGSGGSCE